MTSKTISYSHDHNQGSSPKEVFQEAASVIYLYLRQPMDEYQDPTNVKSIFVRTKKTPTCK